MKVAEVMHATALTCPIDSTLDRVARVMSDGDCGSVPLVDEQGKLVGIVTDRDVCMAAFTQGKPLASIPTSSAAAREVKSVHASDDIEAVELLMRAHKVRRVPVVDTANHPIGMVAFGDLVNHVRELGRRRCALSAEAIARTLAAVTTKDEQGG